MSLLGAQLVGSTLASGGAAGAQRPPLATTARAGLSELPGPDDVVGVLERAAAG